MEEKKMWRQVHGFVTPGGDPLWACPECGWEHCHGVERAGGGPYNKCPKCGISLIYPWEKESEEK